MDRNFFSRLDFLELMTLSEKQQALDDDNFMLIHTHLTLILTQLKKKTGSGGLKNTSDSCNYEKVEII